MGHKAGFVSIIGKPNAGKSTLMNALVGEKMSIITPKAQTTRHRILGIVNTDDYQIVFSDTPGIIKPHYELHERMMHQVDGSIVDADLILLVTDIHEEYNEEDVLKKLERIAAPLIVVVNKIDQSDETEVKKKVDYWQEKLKPESGVRYICPAWSQHTGDNGADTGASFRNTRLITKRMPLQTVTTVSSHQK
jgi:GTP-binding protein Era